MKLNLKKRTELLKAKSADNEAIQLKTNIMVLLTCSIMLLLRMSEVYFFVKHRILDNMNNVRNYKANKIIDGNLCTYLFELDICAIYLKIADFFYILSNSFNVFFYFMFNSKFKESISYFKTKINKKKPVI